MKHKRANKITLNASKDIEPCYIKLGNRINSLRVVKGMTQDELAKKMKLQRTSIANIEAGRQRMLLHQVFDAANALGVACFRLLQEL